MAHSQCASDDMGLKTVTPVRRAASISSTSFVPLYRTSMVQLLKGRLYAVLNSKVPGIFPPVNRRGTPPRAGSYFASSLSERGLVWGNSFPLEDLRLSGSVGSSGAAPGEMDPVSEGKNRLFISLSIMPMHLSASSFRSFPLSLPICDVTYQYDSTCLGLNFSKSIFLKMALLCQIAPMRNVQKILAPFTYSA